MDTLHVITYPHEALRTPANPVTVFNKALVDLIQQMFTLMYQEEGAGLAAPQVGLPLQLFVLDVSQTLDEPRCLINPKILDKQGECDSQEGCLSLPNVYVQIKRAAQITVEYQDEKGNPQTWTAEGLAARAIQHECDHLMGIVLLDHLSTLKKRIALKKINKYKQHNME